MTDTKVSKTKVRRAKVRDDEVEKTENVKIRDTNIRVINAREARPDGATAVKVLLLECWLYISGRKLDTHLFFEDHIIFQTSGIQLIFVKQSYQLCSFVFIHISVFPFSDGVLLTQSAARCDEERGMI